MVETTRRNERLRRRPDQDPYGLSRRELQTLALLAQGLTNREIAARLLISVATVNKHVSSILAKLRAPSRTAAAVHAIALGLVRPSLRQPPRSPP